MKKIFKSKIFKTLIVLMFLAFVALVIALYTHSSWLPSVVASQIESATGKKTEIKTLSLSFSSDNNIEMTGFKIEGMTEIDSLRAKIELSSILTGRYVMSNLTIDKIHYENLDILAIGSCDLSSSYQKAGLDLTIPLVSLDELLKAFAPASEEVEEDLTEETKKDETPIDQTLLAETLVNKEMNFTANIDTLIYSQIPITKAKLDLSVAKQVLTIKELSAEVKKGKIKMLAHKNFVGKRDLSTTLQIDNVYLDQDLINKSSDGFWLIKLLNDIVFSLVPAVEGELSGKMTFVSSGLEVHELISAADGLVAFKVANARVKNPVWLTRLSKQLKTAADLYKLYDPKKSFKFQKIASFLNDGRYDSVDLKVVIKNKIASVNMEMKDSRGLPGLMITGDVELDPKSPETSKAEFLVSVTHLSKSDEKHFKEVSQLLFSKDAFLLGSRLNDLSVNFNKDSVKKTAVQEGRKAIEKKFGKEVEKKVGKELKGILDDLFK